MIFGFDFDNTLINYNKIFYAFALKKKLIKKKNKKDKNNIKKIIFKNKKVKEWIKLQSTVYSQGIHKAKPNKDLILTLKFLKRKKIKFYVVSHKTQFPYYGERINLHRISKNWLNSHIFNKKNRLGNCKYYFETSVKKKIKRIKKLKITHFVDDLEEIIDLMPTTVYGILYKKENFKLNTIKNLVNRESKI
tara:strand:+ start:10 stop:582 length:573 start_codon:yes stop_codon:yes gene_type:complete